MSTLESWDEQIRLFAKYFLRHANLPKHSFTLLDIGCGTGAALGEIKRNYPNAQLFGCDLEKEHVEIARRMNGTYASFYRADIHDITDRYDIIYLSNILEHLTDWRRALDHLLSLCNRLYILVPYREALKNEQSGVPFVDHLVPFDEKTFDDLRDRGTSIEMKIIRTPYAWGHPLKRELALRIKALLNGGHFEMQRELLVAITTGGIAGNTLPDSPFFSRMYTWQQLLRN